MSVITGEGVSMIVELQGSIKAFLFGGGGGGGGGSGTWARA